MHTIFAGNLLFTCRMPYFGNVNRVAIHEKKFDGNIIGSADGIGCRGARGDYTERLSLHHAQRGTRRTGGEGIVGETFDEKRHL